MGAALPPYSTSSGHGFGRLALDADEKATTMKNKVKGSKIMVMLVRRIIVSFASKGSDENDYRLNIFMIVPKN